MAKKINKSMLKVLFIGDIVGKPGRFAVESLLPDLRKERGIDLVIANGENLASGSGMTLPKYEDITRAGVDFFTSGNHIFKKKEFIPFLDDPEIKVVRPANCPEGSSGRGYAEITVLDNKILILNLIGQVFMWDEVESPFVVARSIVQDNPDKIIIIDFHAEATSEKAALANYLDGAAAVVVGTHTHVQTADERILPGGTAFITDAGMCGPLDSIIGIKKEIIIEKFLTQLPISHKVASGDTIFNAAEIVVNMETKKAVSIERISRIVKLS